jgi:hypothetical protein
MRLGSAANDGWQSSRGVKKRKLPNPGGCVTMSAKDDDAKPVRSSTIVGIAFTGRR